MWYMDTVEFYSATNKSKIVPIAGKCIQFEIIILSIIRQTQKDKSHMFSFFYIW